MVEKNGWCEDKIKWSGYTSWHEPFPQGSVSVLTHDRTKTVHYSSVSSRGICLETGFDLHVQYETLAN